MSPGKGRYIRILIIQRNKPKHDVSESGNVFGRQLFYSTIHIKHFDNIVSQMQKQHLYFREITRNFSSGGIRPIGVSTFVRGNMFRAVFYTKCAVFYTICAVYFWARPGGRVRPILGTQENVPFLPIYIYIYIYIYVCHRPVRGGA